MTFRLNPRALGATLSALLLGLSLVVSPAIAKTPTHATGSGLHGPHKKVAKHGKAPQAHKPGKSIKAGKSGKAAKARKGSKLAKHSAKGAHRIAHQKNTLR